MNNGIILKFKKIKIDHSWSFSDKTRKDTAYITHGYHRYPAKFIPQIVSRLIDKYANKNSLVVDPFGGCGTTLVESKINGKESMGVDINPVAVLITKVKITPLHQEELESIYIKLKQQIEKYNNKLNIKLPENERIDYWFKPEQKRKLAFLLKEIMKIQNQDFKDFFLCAFSNILKNCSIWLQKSNKPTRDQNKKLVDPFLIFNRQVKMMLRGNNNFCEQLKKSGYLNISSKIFCTDARTIPVKDGSVDLIITSPPYVTSYEYADLHQLTALWFEYAKSLNEFRKNFIGTSYHNKKELILNSQIAENIQKELLKKDKKTAEEVSNYFGEMNQVFSEMKRILKKDGKTCIVIGNTKLNNIEILNAEVFTEQLQNLGLKIVDIIKREIPSKNLPSVRDKKTGQFAKINNKNKTSAYPTEYILIMKK